MELPKNVRIRKQKDGRYYASMKYRGEFATGATRQEALDVLMKRLKEGDEWKANLRKPRLSR